MCSKYISFFVTLAFCINASTSTTHAVLLEDLIEGNKLDETFTNKRIGYYMGSFDPFHLGHEGVVKNVREQDLCDFVLVYPMWGGDPHKQRTDIAHRFLMIFNLYKDHPNVIVTAMPPQTMQSHLTKPTTIMSDNGLPFIESAIEGTTYAAIIGSDTALAIANPENNRQNSLRGIQIPQEYYNHTRGCSRALPVQSFIISPRTGDDISTLGSKIYDRLIIGIINDPNELGISSTMIRERSKNHIPINSLISEGVDTVINLYRLYQPKDNTLWNSHEIKNILIQGDIVSQQSMGHFLTSQGKIVDYTSDVSLIELSESTRAVFKTFDEHDLREINEANAEVVAYSASQSFGLANVPPTVMRKINDKRGSLQLYVDSEIDAQKDDNYQKAMEFAEQKELQDLKVFYFLFRQWDVGKNNIIIKNKNSKTHLIAIDNANISHPQYVQYGDLPFVMVRSAQPSHNTILTSSKAVFPFDLAETFNKPIGNSLHEKYGDAFPTGFYNRSNTSGPIFFVVFYFKIVFGDNLMQAMKRLKMLFIRMYAPGRHTKSSKPLINLHSI